MPVSSSRAAAQGAKPSGAIDEASAAAAVRAMFDGIAPRYDLLNHVLSLNVDRLWWRRTARHFSKTLARPDAVVLDVCCGTGDMTLALLRRRLANARPVIAVDFSHQMLVRGAAKFAAAKGFKDGATAAATMPSAIAIEADALHLPLADNSVDLITTAFGFRNLANYRAGLDEFQRVLRPCGELGILDFSEPGGLLGKLYAFYFRCILPGVGSLVSGTRGPYAYLPNSVHNFPPPAQMLAIMQDAGFSEVSWTPYTFGVAGLYRAIKNGLPNRQRRSTEA
jgi:demethylmenaquinone methyltransferase / 2-methoxy-6-polyprenyl-1,4-benzoquinol methylase